MRLHGCFITPELDSSNERFLVDGVDFSELRDVTMDDYKTVIGRVVSVGRVGDRILGVVDIDPNYEHLCTGKKMFFGVGGQVFERNEDLLIRCRLTAVALTAYGVHPDYEVKVSEHGK